MTKVLDHPPLRAIARFLEMPPVPTLASSGTERDSLSIAIDLEAVLANACEDLDALPLQTPTAIQRAALLSAWAGQRLLPYPSDRDALQQLVGWMQQRVLASTHLDSTFHDRTRLQNFRRACDHFHRVRLLLISPANCPAELLRIRHLLADFSVYLAFATYASIRSPLEELDPETQSGGPTG